MWILLIMTTASVSASSTIETISFRTKSACQQAAAFYTFNPYPAHNSIAKCVFDGSNKKEK